MYKFIRYCFSKYLYQFTLTSTVYVFLFFIFQTLDLNRFLNFYKSMGKKVFHGGLFIFLTIQKIELTLIDLLTIYISISVKCLFISFVNFLLGWLLFGFIVVTCICWILSILSECVLQWYLWVLDSSFSFYSDF